MPTIAFSHKQGFWKTRYSFLSYCYAFLDRRFLSFNLDFINQPAWEHNSDVTARTTYYGGAADGSQISVSFNDRPSMNKLYKALSLESTNNVVGENTFFVNNSSVPNQIKQGNTGPLTERGGIMYAHIGRNQTVGGANVKVIGQMINAPVLTYDEVNYYPIEYVDGVGTYNLSASSDTTRYFFRSNTGDAIVHWTTDITVAFDPGLDFTEYPQDIQVVSNVIGENVIGIASNGIAIPLNGDGQLFPTYLCSVSIDTVNGDDPKGQTADLIINLGANEYELYALNLEYEPTDYDHRARPVMPATRATRTRRRR